MSINMTLIKIMEENMNQVHIFNYDKQVRKTVRECKAILKPFPPEIVETKLQLIGDTLHSILWDTYPEALRNKEVWNRYYQKIITQIPILPIDVTPLTKEGEKIHETH